MKKIQYASDFHLEFPANSHWLAEHPLEAVGDVLVLAGDITVLSDRPRGDADFLDWCAAHFEHTFIVPGNHEFYKGGDVLASLEGMELELREGVTVLNNRSVVIDDTELFFTTLWTHIPPTDIALVDRELNDCEQVAYGNRRFNANDYDVAHARCLRWLKGALAASTAAHKVVVTHHCPIDVEDPRYASNGLKWAFIVPLERFIMDSGVDHWIYGHTHYNGGDGMEVGHTRMHTNQMGYVRHGVCDNFKAAAVIV